MKKIAIMLLSAMVVFSFVACSNTGRTVNTLDAVPLTTANSSDDNFWDSTTVKPDDFGTVAFGNNGVVGGTLKPVEGFTEFNTAATEEQSGYYFGILVQTKDLEGATMTLLKNGAASEDKTDMAFDDQIVFRVADLAEGEEDPVLNANTWGVRVTKGNATYEATFDLSGVELAKAAE